MKGSSIYYRNLVQDIKGEGFDYTYEEEKFSHIVVGGQMRENPNTEIGDSVEKVEVFRRQELYGNDSEMSARQLLL